MTLFSNSVNCALSKKLKNQPKQLKILQCFAMSVLLLCITDILYRITYQHAAALEPRVYNVKIPAIDDRIPVVPIFLFGYIWSFFYWFFAPFFIIQTGKEKTSDFLITFAITLTLCALIQYVFPTKINRVSEGLWDPSHSSFLWKLLHICYNVDGGNISYSLLPSIHCANSVLFYQAMRDNAIPRKFRIAALLSTILVIVSTLFTKQHFFLDAVIGVLIPVIVNTIVRRIALRFRTTVRAV